jgi:hypothetical protein
LPRVLCRSGAVIPLAFQLLLRYEARVSQTLSHHSKHISLRAFGAFAAAFALISTPAAVRAAIELPEPSQQAMVKQRIGLTDITITYHRPLVGGRKVWGAMVPFGEVWRAGANENTTIEVTDPVSVEGQPLPKGVYGLHMIPTAETWTVIFSKMANAWGSYTYNQAEDALRVTVKPQPIEMEEALEFEFDEVKPDSALVKMKWEKIAVPFRISVSDETTFAKIREYSDRGHGQWEWDSLAQAAQFALTKKTGLEDALRWVDRSIQLEERFENLSTKADLLKALNRAEEAKATAAKAMEKAAAPQLYGYARQLQSQKRDAEAMEIFPAVVKRFPNTVFAHLSSARLNSAAGKFDEAIEDVKKAQGVALSEQQKTALNALIDRLKAKQDINK